MAIVFISPKKVQKLFFLRIVLSFALFAVIVSLFIFIPNFINNTQDISLLSNSDHPNVAINLTIIDSPEVKALEPFTVLLTPFTYAVQDAKGKTINGNISAASKDEAKALLEASGFKVVNLNEMSIGRSQPFLPY